MENEIRIEIRGRGIAIETYSPEDESAVAAIETLFSGLTASVENEIAGQGTYEISSIAICEALSEAADGNYRTIEELEITYRAA